MHFAQGSRLRQGKMSWLSEGWTHPCPEMTSFHVNAWPGASKVILSIQPSISTRCFPTTIGIPIYMSFSFQPIYTAFLCFLAYQQKFHDLRALWWLILFWSWPLEAPMGWSTRAQILWPTIAQKGNSHDLRRAEGFPFVFGGSVKMFILFSNFPGDFSHPNIWY